MVEWIIKAWKMEDVGVIKGLIRKIPFKIGAVFKRRKDISGQLDPADDVQMDDY